MDMTRMAVPAKRFSVINGVDKLNLTPLHSGVLDLFIVRQVVLTKDLVPINLKSCSLFKS